MQVCHKASQPETEIASEVGLAQMLNETAINSECCYDETMSKGTNKIHWDQPESHVSKQTHTVGMGLHNLLKVLLFFLKKDCQIRKLHFQNLLGNDAKHIYYWFYFVKIHFWNVLTALTQSFMWKQIQISFLDNQMCDFTWCTLIQNICFDSMDCP